MGFEHIPVMAKEAVEGLNVRSGGIYFDGTAGGGGHSLEVARRKGPGRLICVDKDPAALAACRDKLAGFEGASFVKANFREIRQILDNLNILNVDGILLDLGASSHQFDTPSRGFSYSLDAPLDMRMSDEGISAYEIVNNLSGEELAGIIRGFGEERFAGRIAREIVKARSKEPIKTTFELAGIIKAAIPAPARREGGNPCKRTFQAIRIAVNSELESVEEMIEAGFECLSSGGRFVVITFHSLEDRIVKRGFAKLCSGCVCPPDFPVCGCGKMPKAKPITKKPLLPRSVELEQNPRSASAKLRIIEKI